MLDISEVLQGFHLFFSPKKTEGSVNNSPPLKPRIVLGTKFYGTGDSLTSLFLNGKRLPKDSPAHRVYSGISETKHELSYFLCEHNPELPFLLRWLGWKWLPNCIKLLFLRVDQIPYLEERDIYILEWFKTNLHSLGSFCFLWGKESDDNKHIFPKSVLKDLEDRITYFQTTEINGKALTDCQDFLSYSDIRLLRLDRLNNAFRDLEIDYTAWHRHLFGLVEPEGARQDTAAILNRISTYLFSAIRYYSLKLNIPESYWQAGVTDYNPPTFDVKENG